MEFDNPLEKEFYRKYYVERCYNKRAKNSHERAKLIKLDALRFLETGELN